MNHLSSNAVTYREVDFTTITLDVGESYIRFIHALCTENLVLANVSCFLNRVSFLHEDIRHHDPRRRFLQPRSHSERQE